MQMCTLFIKNLVSYKDALKCRTFMFKTKKKLFSHTNKEKILLDHPFGIHCLKVYADKRKSPNWDKMGVTSRE